MFYPNNFQANFPFNQGNLYPQPQFIVKQVSNISEAQSFVVDPLSTYLFIDNRSKKIYLKYLNNSGLTEFQCFALEQNDMADPIAEIKKRLIYLENKIGGANEPVHESNVDVPKPDGAEYEVKQPAAFPKSSANDEWKERGSVENNGYEYSQRERY